MPPKELPLTKEQEEAKRLEKNAKARARYASKTPDKKAAISFQNIERREVLKRKKTPEENEAALREQTARRKLQQSLQPEEQLQAVRMLEADRQQTGRSQETENERTCRLNLMRSHTELLRSEETNEERVSRLLADWVRHHVYIIDETEEQEALRRENNVDHMPAWRESFNEDEGAEDRIEKQIRMAVHRERLRAQQEESDELKRAMEADTTLLLVLKSPMKRFSC